MNPITQSIGFNQHDGAERKLWRGTGGRSDFRISLSRTSAAPSADQTAKTLAYLVPVGKGLVLDLFDGEDWVPRKIAYDPDSANTRDVTTTDLAVMTTTTVPYDQFVRWRGGKAETKLVAWASATARNGASIAAPWLHESGLGMHQGILCRADSGAGAAAAGRLDPFWRYVATLYPSASGQCEDSAAKRYVYNHFNKVARNMGYSDGGSHTYTTASWRQWNASTAAQINYVCGVAGGEYWISVFADILPSSNFSYGYVGAHIDGTTSANIYAKNGWTLTWTCGAVGSYATSLGRHFIAATELGNGGFSTTFSILYLYGGLYL